MHVRERRCFQVLPLTFIRCVNLDESLGTELGEVFMVGIFLALKDQGYIFN